MIIAAYGARKLITIINLIFCISSHNELIEILKIFHYMESKFSSSLISAHTTILFVENVLLCKFMIRYRDLGENYLTRASERKTANIPKILSRPPRAENAAQVGQKNFMCDVIRK